MYLLPPSKNNNKIPTAKEPIVVFYKIAVPKL